ncbi:putative rRNA methylase YtqB isoform X2 [Telopea speciosissima]|nr:putative rRNA methylase YtqB isoform X2 [Telopea speciosissima]
MGYISGKKKATEVAHSMWRHIVRKGDTVVDATCGNGHDTLAMVKLVADESCRGCVYGMDIQNLALENTSLLLDALLNPNERKLVKLFHACHSRMEDIVPKGTSVRLVAFNLGYLPGGDKAVITLSETTLPALEAASRILAPNGIISIIAYVGHPGGRKEFETVQAFASGLPVDDWVCSKFEMINRQMSPVLVILFKK